VIAQRVFAAKEHKTFAVKFEATAIDGTIIRPPNDPIPPGKSLSCPVNHSPSASCAPWPADVLKPDGLPSMPFAT
jgi:hypothetical protein